LNSHCHNVSIEKQLNKKEKKEKRRKVTFRKKAKKSGKQFGILFTASTVTIRILAPL
jgi:hypothetical protein